MEYYLIPSYCSPVPYLVPILFSLIIIIGSIGNILVVLVVALNKNMRNNTNMLILNLAVSSSHRREERSNLDITEINEGLLTSSPENAISHNDYYLSK